MAVYAFSDLHGQYELWKKIKEFLKEDDIAFCLGDCCDRQPNGLQIIKEILQDKRITYIIGNHEDMLIANSNTRLSCMDAYDLEIIKYNGAIKTMQDLCAMKQEKKKQLIDNLQNLAYYSIYENKNKQKIILCHSGLDIHQVEHFNITDFIWNRKHLMTKKWDYLDFPDYYIVHGHTPVQYLYYKINGQEQKKLEIIKYCEGHKIDIDLASFDTGVAALLNLDTLEPIYFSIDNFKK